VLGVAKRGYCADPTGSLSRVRSSLCARDRSSCQRRKRPIEHSCGNLEETSAVRACPPNGGQVPLASATPSGALGRFWGSRSARLCDLGTPQTQRACARAFAAPSSRNRHHPDWARGDRTVATPGLLGTGPARTLGWCVPSNGSWGQPRAMRRRDHPMGLSVAGHQSTA
jgi:hypothetical protein